MKGRKFLDAGVRVALPGIVLALCACASTPAAHPEVSILDAVNQQRMNAPVSCAAMGASSVCEKSTRLGSTRNCGCADPHALADGVLQRY
jgi:hypothetical protein